MLETTLSTTFTPGTNLKGQAIGGNWLFLLPGLNLERVVCIGEPSAAILSALSRLGQRVTVLDKELRPVQEVHQVAENRDGASGRADNLASSPTLSFGNGSVDLALIVGGRNVRRFARDRAMRAEVGRMLKPEGVVYYEFGGLTGRLLGIQANGHIEDWSQSQPLWLTPTIGETHTAVPLHDRQTMHYFLRHGLYSPSVKPRVFKRAVRFLDQRLASSRWARRYGALAARKGTLPLDEPPQYLRSAAKKSGVNLDRYRWGLVAGGGFSSRKLLFFLFNPTSGELEYVVKMVRDPIFNARLENEYRALSLLAKKEVGDYETVPQPVFCDHHSNLAMVGETPIQGVPLRKQSEATAACPYTRAAVEWLTGLGAATANSTAVTPEQVAEVLHSLFVRFNQIYRVTPSHQAFLASQIEAVAGSDDVLPLVFQHGDPGMWNVLVTHTGRIAFLDWEAAEPQGMPLWDLFYFIRSCGIWSARVAGTRGSLKAFTQQFLKDSAFSQLLAQATADYCERVGVPRNLVEPLFYTCWMHRALKEATRLAPAKLEKGHYANLIRLCIEQRNVPTLKRLFSR